MTSFEYPPSREFTLEGAKQDVAAEFEDAKQRVERLEADEDAQDSRVAEAYQERNQLAAKRDGLEWAIQEFGGDARIVLEAFTATTRARTLDELNRSTMGRVGSEETRVWLLAAALQEAPWLTGGEDLTTTYEVTGALPPSLQDYLDGELNAVNDLSEGNL